MKVTYRSSRPQKLNVRREVVIDDFAAEFAATGDLAVRPTTERGCFEVLGSQERLERLPLKYEEFSRGELMPDADS
jgi:hypothetical protein